MTPKQARFVSEYLIDMNATAAAKRAGYKNPEIGRQLITKNNVAAAIAAAIKKREKKTEITAEYVLSNLKTIVERCMSSSEFDARGAAKALELLGKHLGMFTDKVKVEGGAPLLVLNAEMTAEAARRARQIAQEIKNG